MNELYTATEISRMTNDALDELLSYYQDKGNALGAEMVQDEITTRYDEDEEPPVEDYDPGPECDDMGGMSEVEFGHPIG